MSAVPSVAELLKKLDEQQQALGKQQQAYWQTLREVHAALVQAPASNPTPGPSGGPPSTKSAKKQRRRSTQETRTERPDWIAKAKSDPPKDADGRPLTLGSSVITGESDESDVEEEFYVQKPLPSYTFDLENLRHHLKKHKFNEHGQKLLETEVDHGRLLHPTPFREYPSDEKWHNSHYSVFDVSKDGAPLSRSEVVEKGSHIDSAIWQAIQNLNTDPESQRPAVGRITIVREPSPIILGALHMTMNKDFNMDELFDYLAKDDHSQAHVSGRNFSHDHREQRSFVFKFDYFTIVENDVQPMPWQQSDSEEKLRNKPLDHIPLSRCSSVVALSLSGEHMKRLRNNTRKARKEHNDHGLIFDPWAPWHVVNIQCYPDHKASLDIHDSTKHYVNGPEAFLHTVLAEFQDAEKRFAQIYRRISKLVTPPSDFMFDGGLRDKLLFEDDEFTYSRRYFWAFQTLGLMRDGIKAIIDAYEKTFTDDVWEGRHKTLWPMMDERSKRNEHYKKRMAHLKKDFEKIIKDLHRLDDDNDERRKEIRTLRDQLFNGTSVLESRKSVELSTVTILQGHNIKLLTLVSIFFLPLTFVTSVFGMTDMPSHHFFKYFAVTMTTVCIPFFLLIGSLNTTSGMEFWRGKWHDFLGWTQFWRSPHQDDASIRSDEHTTRRRSMSIDPSWGRGRRPSVSKGQRESIVSMTTLGKGRANSSAGHSQPQKESGIELTQVEEGESANSTAAKTVTQPVTSVASAENGTTNKISWFDKLTGGRKRSDEHNV